MKCEINADTAPLFSSLSPLSRFLLFYSFPPHVETFQHLFFRVADLAILCGEQEGRECRHLSKATFRNIIPQHFRFVSYLVKDIDLFLHGHLQSHLTTPFFPSPKSLPHIIKNATLPANLKFLKWTKKRGWQRKERKKNIIPLHFIPSFGVERDASRIRQQNRSGVVVLAIDCCLKGEKSRNLSEWIPTN